MVSLTILTTTMMGMATHLDEDLNANGDPTDDDTDKDGMANYLESCC